MTFPMAVGATTVLLAGAADAGRRSRRSCAGIRSTVFYAVPTFYAAFLASPDAPRASELRLRCCVSAGEALPPDVGRRWKERYGVDILDGIGSTEMLHIFLSNRPGDVKYGTTGKPVPGYDMRLVDDDGNVIASAGEMGELQVRGPTSALMYWNNRERSRATFLGEWTRSGDKYVAGRGRLLRLLRPARRHAQGRRHLCLAVRGRRRALHAIREVLEAAVVAWPDEDELIKPKAFVVLKSADKACDELARALQEHVKSDARALQVSALDRVPHRAARRPRPARSSASSCARSAPSQDNHSSAAGLRTAQA